MPTSSQPRGFGPQMPEAPQLPQVVQEQPASLGEQATRLAVVGALLFALPTWMLITWGFAIWIGGWVFVVFAPLGLAVIGAGLCVFAAPLWDQVQAFRYKQLHRRQDHYHRGLIVQTQVWLLRLHGLATYHRGPRLDPDAARIAGIPVYANGVRVGSSTKPYVAARYTETPTPEQSWHSANPGRAAATLGDDYEPAETAEAAERDTRQLTGPQMSAVMSQVYRLWPSVQPKWRTCEALGVKRADWQRAMDEFERLGYVRNDGPGKGYKWL